MLGLTMDKVLLIVVIAAVVLGPQRLPHYAQRLGELVRQVRDHIESTRTRTEQETGVSLSADDWKAWDPRRYDPRQIVRDALEPRQQTASAPAPTPPTIVVAPGDGTRTRAADAAVAGALAHPAVPCETCGSPAAAADPHAPEPATERAEGDAAAGEAGAPPRRQRWIVVGGTSGHPIRRLVDVEDEDADRAS